MKGVDAAIGELRRHTCLRRVIAPADAGVVHVGGIGVVAMGELGHDKAHLAKIAARHHCAHVAHQRISGIAIVHGADLAGAAGGQHQILGLGLGHSHGLFAQDVDPGLKERSGDFVVGRIGGGDGDKVDAVGACDLTREHFAPVAIGAVRGDPQAPGKGATARGIMVQRAGNKIEMRIKTSRKPVRGADLAAITTADHAPVQFRHRRSPRIRLR